MKEQDKISVIIPTYNRASLISKSIKSIINQSYRNIEIIIIDDASTDNTEKVVKKIKDERIRYYKLKENKGACNARNIGIQYSTGKYITFQDSDDIYHVEKIKKQYESLKKNKSDMDFCKICIHDGDINTEIPAIEQENSILQEKIIDELCNGNFISTQAIFIKKSIIEKYMFDVDLPRFQDFDLIMRMLPNIKISYCNEVLVDLYRQKDSISNNNKKLKTAIDIMKNKEYNLNNQQKEKLNNWMTSLYIFNIEYELNNKINALSKENEILKQNVYTLEQKLDEKDLELKKINNLYNELSFKYGAITNSKRWKFIDKLGNIKSKITK